MCAKGGPYPLLWNFGMAPQTADLVLARPLVTAALEQWGRGAIRWLIMDAGLVDRPWMRGLNKQGIDTIIRLRKGMDNLFLAQQS